MEEDCDICYNLKPRGYINASIKGIVESVKKGRCNVCPLLYNGLRQFDESLYPERLTTKSQLADEEQFLFPWPEDRFMAAEFYILHGLSM